jgi:hypothetical protein
VAAIERTRHDRRLRRSPSRRRRLAAACLAWTPPPLPPAPAAEAAPVDPVLRFNETRVGHLLFETGDTMECRRVLFDNRTGYQQEAGQVYCGPIEARMALVFGVDRLQSIGKTFLK